MYSNTERWLPICGYEGVYEVSDSGSVWSIRHGRNLILQTSNSGYHFVHLWRNNQRASRFVHRLMAASFIVGYSDELMVNHIDGNKKNNVVINFEMVTASENMLHSVHVLGNRSAMLNGLNGAENGFSKPVLQLSIDGQVLQRFECRRDAVRKGFNAACITECCNGTQKTHKGYRWSHVQELGAST